MASIAHLVSTVSTSNGATYTSGSFTPTVGDRLIILAAASGSISGAGTATASANGLTFKPFARAKSALTGDTIYAYVSSQAVPASPVAMTVTANTPGDAATGMVIEVFAVRSVTRLGLSLIRQIKFTEMQAAGVPAVTFASAPLSGNPQVGVVVNLTNPADLTPPSGFTEAADTGYATPTTGLEYAFLSAGSTTSTVTWGSSSATAFGAMIIEFDASAAATEAMVASSLAEVLVRPNPDARMANLFIETLTRRIAQTSYRADVLSDIPLAYYRLDDLAGTTMTDWSGYGRHGTYVGTPTLNTAGLLTGSTNPAVGLNGTTQGGQVAWAAWQNAASFSLEGIIKTTATALSTIWDRDSNTDALKAFQFRMTAAGLLEFSRLRNAGGTNTVITVTGAIAVNDGLRHHVVAVHDSIQQTLSIYVDGVLDVASGLSGGVFQPGSATALGLGVSRQGVGSGSGVQYFNGVIDEFAYYGYALPAKRIASHHTMMVTPVPGLQNAARTGYIKRLHHAISPVALASGFDAADLATYVTASVAPIADAGLLLYVTVGRTDGAAATSATITGLGLTWTLVASETIPSGNLVGLLYRATTGGSPPTPGTISIAFGSTQHNASWHLIQLRGVDTAGWLVQSGHATFGNVAPFTVTLGSAIGAGNAVLGFMCMNTNSFAIVAGSGYTLLGTEQGDDNPTYRSVAEYDLTGTTAVSGDVSGGTANRFMIGVEVKLATAGVWEYVRTLG